MRWMNAQLLIGRGSFWYLNISAIRHQFVCYADTRTHTHTHTDSLGEATVNGVDTPTQPPQEFPSATEPVEVRQDEETFPSAEVPEQDNKG